MLKIATEGKGTWRITGLNLTHSDSIFQKLKSSIEDSKLSQSYLQKITGHRAPITVDMQRKQIDFYSF